MKTALITEGEGEITAIETIIKKIGLTDILQRPLHADLQPKANPKVIARSAKGAISLCETRGVGRVIILIDAEDNPDPASFVRNLEQAFHEIYYDKKIKFCVVAKKIMIENWLISDVLALRQMTGRFDVTMAFERSVTPDKADSVTDPVALLNSIVKNKEYRKGTDPTAISLKFDPLRASRNSRSFRKFLREIGVIEYKKQSKFPFDSPRLVSARRKSKTP